MVAAQPERHLLAGQTCSVHTDMHAIIHDNTAAAVCLQLPLRCSKHACCKCVLQTDGSSQMLLQ
jgi:hypothetical protein